jgi:hypothetical protein
MGAGRGWRRGAARATRAGRRAGPRPPGAPHGQPQACWAAAETLSTCHRAARAHLGGFRAHGGPVFRQALLYVPGARMGSALGMPVRTRMSPALLQIQTDHRAGRDNHPRARRPRPAGGRPQPQARPRAPLPRAPSPRNERTWNILLLGAGEAACAALRSPPSPPKRPGRWTRGRLGGRGPRASAAKKWGRGVCGAFNRCPGPPARWGCGAGVAQVAGSATKWQCLWGGWGPGVCAAGAPGGRRGTWGVARQDLCSHRADSSTVGAKAGPKGLWRVWTLSIATRGFEVGDLGGAGCSLGYEIGVSIGSVGRWHLDAQGARGRARAGGVV